MAIQTYNGIHPTLGHNVFVAESAFVAGDVSLGDDVSIWPCVVARGDVHRIEIGPATNIQDGSVLHVTQPSAFNEAGFPLIVGAGVTVGHRAVLHGCTIGDLCLIGIGAIVMDGAVIEDRVMVGAGTLVPPGKRLESGYLYVGSPVRQARPLKDSELEFLVHSRDGYVKLKNQYLHDLGAV
ncbi:gamma carbonic anhydrase family protein [Methylococcus capsulatus]|uniref:gamma carbonic anhydrase family protein n=1 Tax=Methylococcus capsulatus TaxID=414 RepID=UPI001C52B4D8|nr:gamma carbonic anhydrase family protein [Methylococcus capsulatus]QXP91949.1 gamma carbonic anhydrase family protein [Methylococcus capsulatus]